MSTNLDNIKWNVVKRWDKGSIRIACIGLENQTEPDPDMPLRIYGYDGARYRTQLLKENKGRARYPVVTLVLYFGYQKHWNRPLTLYEAIDIPEILKPFVPDMKINLFEIAYLVKWPNDYTGCPEGISYKGTGQFIPEQF